MADSTTYSSDIFTVQQGFEYLESFVNLENKVSPLEREYRLDRVKYLFKCFSYPDSKIKLIHIAGSKGKGSTGIFAASILKEAGFKTGLYASPHVQSYKERITLAGSFFPNKVYIDNIKKIKEFLEKEDLPFDSPPTTFELSTLLAFLIFRAEGCSWAVIETGLGGRLDATNIITPVVSVITPIELEHTDILGKTIEKIAYEKSGIIKPCITENNFLPALAISAAQKEEAANVLKSKAKEVGREILFLPDAIKIKNISVSPNGTSFTIELLEPVLKLADNINSISGSSTCKYPISTSMHGAFQAKNGVLAALAVFYALSVTFSHKDSEGQTYLQSNKESYNFSNFFSSALTNGIRNVNLPCRIEYFPPVIADNNHNFRPTVILDSSHTPLSTQELAKTIPHLYKDTANSSDSKKVLIFGSVEGKDYKNILKIILLLFDKVIISTPGNFKKSSPKEIYEYLINTETKNSISVYIELEPANAFKKAVQYAGEKGLVAISGSFYMASEIHRLLGRTE